MKISIITVSYNSIKFIESCIMSVKNQSYDNIEHIIVDGASNDGTLSLLSSMRNNFSTLVSEPDKGIYYAMNKGIQLAKGDVIGFLNSDDFYNNDKIIFKVANIFKHNPSLDCCYADLIYTSKLDTAKNIRYWKSNNFYPGLFSKGWCPPHQTFFVRRSVYEKYGSFNLDYNIASDVELMMRFLEVYKINFRYVPEVWTKMRLGGTTNKNLKNIYKQNIEILNALKFHGLTTNWFYFFLNKIISRTLQFLRKSDK